jgi:hypothetical protein
MAELISSTRTPVVMFPTGEMMTDAPILEVGGGAAYGSKPHCFACGCALDVPL